jgi:hypothetical protein
MSLAFVAKVYGPTLDGTSVVSIGCQSPAGVL